MVARDKFASSQSVTGSKTRLEVITHASFHKLGLLIVTFVINTHVTSIYPLKKQSCHFTPNSAINHYIMRSHRSFWLSCLRRCSAIRCNNRLNQKAIRRTPATWRLFIAIVSIKRTAERQKSVSNHCDNLSISILSFAPSSYSHLHLGRLWHLRISAFTAYEQQACRHQHGRGQSDQYFCFHVRSPLSITV